MQTKRLQIDISQDSFERLKSLKQKTDSNSYAEVTNKAYKLLDYIYNHNSKTTIFLMKDKETGEETEIVLL